MNIKKGDQVKIITGKDRGKIGAVSKVFPDRAALTVEGFNVFKKRSRPKRKGEKGEMVLVPRPLHISNVMLICSSCKQPTRAAFRFDGGRKSRFCKKCKSSF